MKTKLLVAAALVSMAVTPLNSQMQAGHSAVEMAGVKATTKLQTPVEGFFIALNGKLDMRASEVEIGPGGSVKDHYHFGPGIRRVLSGELTLLHADSKKEQVVRTGEYFYEAGDVSIQAFNRGKDPAKLLVVELVPAGLKGSAMVPLDRQAELATTGSRLKDEICSPK